MNKFVVFEGLDGSGKSTQIEMLMDYLVKKKVSHKFLHFPRINETMIGEMIARFLRGEFGDIKDVDPYFVALMYSQDRFDAKQFLLECINNYQLLIVDRYVLSNVAFQCAKYSNIMQKEELRNWILKLEYEHYSLPKPDITLYLKVPFNFVQDTLTNSRTGKDREYLKGGIDVHENDLVFQKNVEQEYLKLIDVDPNFKVVNCENENNSLLSPSEINHAIIQLLDLLA